MQDNSSLSTLRALVLAKSGLSNIDPGRCKNISDYIFQDTKNYLSETTIKRFFGFANTQHKFSLFTLNSLSQYVGYSNWNIFCNKNIHLSTEENLWKVLKLEVKSITQNTLTIKKNKLGLPSDITAERNFYYPDFEYFLNNNYHFTTLSAQPGHGKSTLLTNLVDKYTNTANGSTTDNILLLLNSSSFKSALLNKFSINEYFKRELNLITINELNEFAINNPLQCNGKFIILIDDIDDLLTHDEYLKVLIEFLTSIERNSIIKIVLVLRTNIWANLQQAISKSAYLNKFWYKGLFTDTEQPSNIPPLSTSEVLQTLSKIENKTITESNVHVKLLNQFKTPFWIQTYYNLKQENDNIRLKNPALCYDLIEYYIDEQIFLAKKSSEKIWLLKKIANTISEGNKGLRVSKEKLLYEINLHNNIYDELLYSGIIVEEKRFTTTTPTEIITFLNFDIYTYIVFLELLEKFNYKINEDYFNYVLENYNNSSQNNALILNWSVRFCVTRNQYFGLKNLFNKNFPNSEKIILFRFIGYTVQYELSKNHTTLKLTEDLLDLLLSNKTIGYNYTKTLHKFSQNNLNHNYDLQINAALATVYIFNVNKTPLNSLMLYFKKNYNQLNKLFKINPYYIIHSFINNLPQNTQILKEKIYDILDNLNSKELHLNELSTNDIISYRLCIIVLFQQKNYEDCNHFINTLLSTYPKKAFIRNAEFGIFVLNILAQIALKLNEIKKAEKILKFLKKLNDNIYQTAFCSVNLYALETNFLTYTEQYEEALHCINTAILLAEKHKYNGYIIAMLLIKIDVLKALGYKETLAETIQYLVKFLDINNIDMPEYVNVLSREKDNTFYVLKSYSKSSQ
jgi:hypothetical protein